MTPSGPTLAWLRNSRNRRWWDHALAMGRLRVFAGIVRDRAGPRTEWEDVFVEMWGLAWRDRLHNTPSLAEWQALWPEFAATVCDSWCLPDFHTPDRRATDEGPILPSPKRRRFEVSTAALPPTHGDGDLHSAPRWFSGSGCFLFVVDCEPLAQVVHGQAPLRLPLAHVS